jgi:Zn-dependent peptidase ImmA (M78 family)
MAETELQLDLMELADLAQPTRIAHEIHAQLRRQFGSVPLRSPLKALSEAVGIVGIKLFDTAAFEGTLVIKDGKGAVGLRKGLQAGRRNFTLAHEIGHFLIPNHRLQRPKFECTATDLTRKRRGGGNFAIRPALERIEIEANEFAAALLVPMPEYRDQLKRLPSGCDVGHIRALADAFAVSQEFMAQIYVNSVSEKAAVIIAHDAIVKRVITPTGGFPYLGLRAGSPLPAAALARTFKPGPGEMTSDLCEVLTDRWLEERGSVTAIFEQVRIQTGGWTMTLIAVDEEEADNDGDDRSWNRRNHRRA